MQDAIEHGRPAAQQDDLHALDDEAFTREHRNKVNIRRAKNTRQDLSLIQLSDAANEMTSSGGGSSMG